jgi:hypothetical protein
MVPTETDKPAGRSAASTTGLSALGTLLTGVAGIILALNAASSNEFVGAGICLAASALAFGLLANAALRT